MLYYISFSLLRPARPRRRHRRRRHLPPPPDEKRSTGGAPCGRRCTTRGRYRIRAQVLLLRAHELLGEPRADLGEEATATGAARRAGQRGEDEPTLRAAARAREAQAVRRREPLDAAAAHGADDRVAARRVPHVALIVRRPLLRKAVGGRVARVGHVGPGAPARPLAEGEEEGSESFQHPERQNSSSPIPLSHLASRLSSG